MFHEFYRFFKQISKQYVHEILCFAFQDADITRHVCWHSLTRIVGEHHINNVSEREKTANELISLHKLCSEHFSDYSSTVTRPYDNYLVLAAHILWELWQETEMVSVFNNI